MSHDQPLVSIGLPVYNGEKYLREALDALTAQDYENLELIISDNASTDRTGEICREYASRDARIRYFRNETNEGPYRNFCRVLELSSGPYFMWAAHDDVWHHAYVRRCAEVLDKSAEAVVSFSAFRLIDEEGQELERFHISANAPSRPARVRQYLSSIETRNNGAPVYGLLRAEALRKVFPGKSASWGGDVVLLTKLCLLGTLEAVPEVLYSYRVFKQKTAREVAVSIDPAMRGRSFLGLMTSLNVEIVREILRFDLSRKERLKTALAAMAAMSKFWPRWLSVGLRERATHKYLIPARENREQGKCLKAASYALRAMLNDPRYIFSHGAWLFVVEAVTGRRLAESARKTFRRHYPRENQAVLGGLKPEDKD